MSEESSSGMYAQNVTLKIARGSLALLSTLVWGLAVIEPASISWVEHTMSFQFRNSPDAYLLMAALFSGLSYILSVKLNALTESGYQLRMAKLTGRIQQLRIGLNKRHSRTLIHEKDMSGFVPTNAIENLELEVRRLEKTQLAAHKAEEILFEERVREQQSEKLEEMSIIAAGVAEQIKQPISLIYSLAEKIQLQARTSELESLVKNAERVQDTSAQISSLIRGLEALVNEQADEQYRLTPLHVLVEDAVKSVKGSIEKHMILLDVKPMNPELLIWCRPMQMSQVLLSLLEDSIEAVHSNESKWIRVEIQELLDSVFISIEDSRDLGRARSAAQPLQPRGGIALSLARDIVESQGGGLAHDPRNSRSRLVLRLPNSRPVTEITSDPVGFDK